MAEISIQEGNRLIAEFIATRIDSFPDKSSTWIVGETGSEVWHNVDSEHWLFHSDWSWIMPVVEKIRKVKFGICFQTSFDSSISIVSVYDYDEEFQVCQNRFSTTEKSPIEVTWLCVVQFIQWYNKTIKQ